MDVFSSDLHCFLDLQGRSHQWRYGSRMSKAWCIAWKAGMRAGRKLPRKPKPRPAEPSSCGRLLLSEHRQACFGLTSAWLLLATFVMLPWTVKGH